MELSNSSNNQQINRPASKLHFLDYWRIIRIRKMVIIAVFLLVLLSTTAITLILPKTYSSTVRISVAKDATDIPGMVAQQRSDNHDPYWIQTQFERIKSRQVLHRVVSNQVVNLPNRWSEKYNAGRTLTTEQTYQILKSKIDTSPTRNTSLIEIKVYSDKPEEAAELAQLIADEYKDLRKITRTHLIEGALIKLREELTIIENQIDSQQTAVDQLRDELKITDVSIEGIPSYAFLEPENVKQMEGAKTRAQLEYEFAKARLNLLINKTPEDLEVVLLTIQADPNLETLLAEKYQAQQELTSLEVFYGPENTDVQNANALLDKVNQQIRDHVRKMIQGYASMAAIALDHSEALQIRLDEVKKEERKATTKYRPYSRAKEKLDELKKIKASLHIRLLAEQVDVNIPTAAIVDIIDPAVKSLKPDRPNIPLNLALGIVFGLVVGVGLAFFIEYLDTSVKTIDDVEAALQAPVLGVIPQNVGSLLDEGPDSPHAEAYRVLRTNMTFSRKDPTKNSLTVVSGGAGEGKSTTLFNLAVVFAQEGQKVLIVDSDLRRPSIHKMMHVTNSIGLTNYLLGQNTLEEVIQTSINPFMDFMPSGKLPSSSMGILNSPQMKELIK
ncbi:MAG TPA: capsular biosynthesis protein, partial [Verrucomicrobia bacterium]|nr:capsular biosynthesis protein [Verrucomicrobiota bacterium]